MNEINSNVATALKQHVQQQLQHFQKMQELKPFVGGHFRGEFYTIMHNLANCINESNYILNGCSYNGYKEIRLSEI